MQDFVRFARMERVMLVWGRDAMHTVYRCELRKNRPLDFARGAAHCVVVWQARQTGVTDLALYEGDPIQVVDASQFSAEQVLALCAAAVARAATVYALRMPYWLPGETVVRVDAEEEANRLMPLVETSRVAPTPARRLELLAQLVREVGGGGERCSACFGDIKRGASAGRFIACGHPLCGDCDASVCNCRHPAHRVAPVDVPVVRVPSDDAYDYQQDSDMVLDTDGNNYYS